MAENHHNHPIGKFGEKLAKEFLEKRGYDIIDSGVYFRVSEIDLVARKNQKLVFIEVKTRLSQKHGGAIYALTKTKFRKIHTAALLYRKKYFFHAPIQIDFIAIQIFRETKKARIRHFQNISWNSFGIG